MTYNLCSKCWRDSPQKKQEEEKQKALQAALNSQAEVVDGKKAMDSALKEVEGEQSTENIQTDPSKCWKCNKNVGLVGFHCRCDYTFCKAHRYSENHECTYDYKSANRDKIKKENPLVCGSKVTKF